MQHGKLERDKVVASSERHLALGKKWLENVQLPGGLTPNLEDFNQAYQSCSQ